MRHESAITTFDRRSDINKNYSLCRCRLEGQELPISSSHYGKLWCGTGITIISAIHPYHKATRSAFSALPLRAPPFKASFTGNCMKNIYLIEKSFYSRQGSYYSQLIFVGTFFNFSWLRDNLTMATGVQNNGYAEWIALGFSTLYAGR